MEYISKDDAKLLIDILNNGIYDNLQSAEKVIPVKKRLQSYIDDPDEKEIKQGKK